MASNYQHGFYLITQTASLFLQTVVPMLCILGIDLTPQNGPPTALWGFSLRIADGLLLINFLSVLSPSSPMACVWKKELVRVRVLFCSEASGIITYQHVFLFVILSPQGQRPKSCLSLWPHLHNIMLWEWMNKSFGKPSLKWLPEILTLQWVVFMPRWNPCCPLSVGKPNDLLLMNRIRQTWQDVTSEIRLQKDYDFHLDCHVLCLLALSPLLFLPLSTCCGGARCHVLSGLKRNLHGKELTSDQQPVRTWGLPKAMWWVGNAYSQACQ